ncbi:MAG: PKD domain-containing protein [Sphingobacteriales bacterium]|nr:PKD domain-containing protein [Sphingobacteriales bacterium]
MKNFYLLLAALLMLQLPLSAQTNTNPCAGLAKFQYVIDGNTVKFTSAPNYSTSIFHYWNFGDGKTADSANPVHVYANGSYRVVHYIKDTLRNCYDSSVAEFQIPVNINSCAGLAKFQYGIYGDTVKFYSPNNLLVHYWKLGDGSTSDKTNPVHVYAPGSYRVVHYIKDTARKCYDSAVAEFTIIKNVECPKPSFQWQKDSFNTKAVKFYNTTGITATIYKFTWQFGDGTSSTDINPTHVYSDTGAYNACLIIEQLNGLCKNYSCQAIIIRPDCNIKPDFTWESAAGNPSKIYFKNLSAPTTTPNVMFSWSFGDGTFSNEVNPQHGYDKPGIYQVCLKMQVTNSDCIKYICKQVVVRTPCDNLYAKFEWKQDSAHPLRGVQFVNLSSSIANAPLGVRWNFGDGTTSSEWNPFHQYNEPGKYRVCLIVKFFDSCYKETCDTVVVPRPEINCEEISKFRFEKVTNDALGYYFAATHRNPNWKYTWTFGDGTGMQGEEAKHRYEKEGKYTVCLTVYKSDACASTTCMEITAGHIPCDDVRIKFETIKGSEIPNRVKFHAISNEGLKTQKWVIYNTTGSLINMPVVLYGPDPVYTFREKGLYKVCLLATTVTGCTKQYCDTLRIGNVIVPTVCELKIFPNPATTHIEFDVVSETNGVLVVNIFDINGVKRSQFMIAAQQGNNHVKIPVESLSAGYYYIEVVQSNGRVCKGKFQKL